MAYSNDPNQIRAGLTNFIGALVNASHTPIKDSKQQVIAVLIEEALKIMQSEREDKVIDMYLSKPLLRATKIFYEQRIAEIEKIRKHDTKTADENIKRYKQSIFLIEELLRSI